MNGKKIAIILALLLLIAAIAAVLLHAKNAAEEDESLLDFENTAQEASGMKDGWSDGADAGFDAKNVRALSIVWESGSVTLEESEGRELAVKADNADSLRYQLKDGILYLENTPDYSKLDSNLSILIPEDISSLADVRISVTAGDVIVSSESIQNLIVESDSGKISLDAENADTVDLSTDSGDILLKIDDDKPFVLNYASAAGEVSVEADPAFRNESGADSSGNAIYAFYDKSGGANSPLNVIASTASGNIKIVYD